jgi:hypothetical protein
MVETWDLNQLAKEADQICFLAERFASSRIDVSMDLVISSSSRISIYSAETTNNDLRRESTKDSDEGSKVLARSC